MNLQNLLNEFVGSDSSAGASGGNALRGTSDTLRTLAGGLPGGLVGGATAGGLMALLLGNKSARKFAGKAATVGGAAVLGGLAYQAYRQWQSTSPATPTSSTAATQGPERIDAPDLQQPAADLTIIKAMISAAQADGRIDQLEHERIFQAVDQMALSDSIKASVFDYLRQPPAVEELASEVDTLEQRSEVYLAACLVAGGNHPAERTYLETLARSLALPAGLAPQLEHQAQQAAAE